MPPASSTSLLVGFLPGQSVQQAASLPITVAISPTFSGVLLTSAQPQSSRFLMGSFLGIGPQTGSVAFATLIDPHFTGTVLMTRISGSIVYSAMVAPTFSGTVIISGAVSPTVVIGPSLTGVVLVGPTIGSLTSSIAIDINFSGTVLIPGAYTSSVIVDTAFAGVRLGSIFIGALPSSVTVFDAFNGTLLLQGAVTTEVAIGPAFTGAAILSTVLGGLASSTVTGASYTGSLVAPAMVGGLSTSVVVNASFAGRTVLITGSLISTTAIDATFGGSVLVIGTLAAGALVINEDFEGVVIIAPVISGALHPTVSASAAYVGFVTNGFQSYLQSTTTITPAFNGVLKNIPILRGSFSVLQPRPFFRDNGLEALLISGTRDIRAGEVGISFLLDVVELTGSASILSVSLSITELLDTDQTTVPHPIIGFLTAFTVDGAQITITCGTAQQSGALYLVAAQITLSDPLMPVLSATMTLSCQE